MGSIGLLLLMVWIMLMALTFDMIVLILGKIWIFRMGNLFVVFKILLLL